MKPPAYVDLFNMTELERIGVIGTRAMRHELVAFVVETDAKASRYMRQLKKSFPRVVEVDRVAGPVANTIMVRVTSGKHLAELRERGEL